MKEFKQWYDDDKITFHTQRQISFGDCTKNRTCGLDHILRFTSDSAVEDYRQRVASREELVAKGFAILVSRTAYRFHRLPVENEDITITTWEEKPQALQLMRQYEITSDATGEKLVTGYSSWLLVDPVKRRIIPTKNFTIRIASDYNKGHDCPEPGKIIVPENMELLDQRVIRFSDLDANGHTTNSRYGAFIEDCLPEKFNSVVWKDFRINFSKEAMLGQKLNIYAAFDDQARKVIVVGKT